MVLHLSNELRQIYRQIFDKRGTRHFWVTPEPMHHFFRQLGRTRFQNPAKLYRESQFVGAFSQCSVHALHECKKARSIA